MNVFDIELYRQFLLLNLPKTHGRSKVFLFFDFYKSLLESNDKTVIEAYLVEFIEEYLNALSNYSIFGISPDKSDELIEQLEKILAANKVAGFNSKLQREIQRLQNQLNQLKSILSGTALKENLTRLSFPLIEEINFGLNETFGFLETVRIDVQKRKFENKLYVFPKVGDLDKNIENQIYDSFSLAVKYLDIPKNKLNQFHEITVYFDNYSANYIGNSLGIALTIGFIEQLSTLYNLPYLVKIRNNIASTGGVGGNGIISPVNQNNIKTKVEVVFYSQTEIFVVSQHDEDYAIKKLKELKELYPNRNLKIIGVNDLDELLDRRTLISISKQNPIIRAAKVSIKNWQVSILVIILYIITAITLFRNFDESPAILETVGKTLYVKNKSSRVLWSREINCDLKLIGSEDYMRLISQLIDVNGDGINEVILTNESSNQQKDQNVYGRISCFDNMGKNLWTYNFSDSISNVTENLQPFYFTSIVDTVSINGKKSLVAFSSNRSSHLSAILILDIKTGKRIGRVLWHNGLIGEALINDFNYDGQKEIAFVATSSSYEKTALGVVDISKISGQCPASGSFAIKNLPFAQLNSYILFPKTDYSRFLKKQIPNLEFGNLTNMPQKKSVYFKSVEGENDATALIFKIKYNWKSIKITPEKKFIAQRDLLIKNGILKPPYTGTKEFENKLSKEILFWNGQGFSGNN